MQFFSKTPPEYNAISSLPAVKTVAVMFGGRSVEHEISVITALQMMQAMDTLKFKPIPVYVSTDGRWYTGLQLLDRNFYRRLSDGLSELTEVTLLPRPGVGGLTVVKSAGKQKQKNNSEFNRLIPVDVFFPCFHGTYGEDGAFQGLFETADVAYTGCDVVSASTGMSKYHCKKFLEAHGIPVLPAVVVTKREFTKSGGEHIESIRRQILSTPGLTAFPLFVKPATLGSSIGISKASNEMQLDAALAGVFKYDTQAMIEPCVDPKMEINVSVFGAGDIRASVVELPIASAGQLTYEDKYLRGNSSKTGKSQGMESLSRLIDPADLDPNLKETARRYAAEAYEKLGCSGVARIDFMVDLRTDRLYFNEINTLPGSLAFYLWSKSEPCLLYTDLITGVIEQALRRQGDRASLKRTVGFAALFQA